MAPTGMPSCTLICGVGDRRVGHEQAQQLATPIAKVGERGPQRGLSLGRDQPLIDLRLVLVRRHVELRVRELAIALPAESLHPDAFAPRCRGEPAGQRRRLAKYVEMFDQPQPDVLSHVVRVGVRRAETDGISTRQAGRTAR